MKNRSPLLTGALVIVVGALAWLWLASHTVPLPTAATPTPLPKVPVADNAATPLKPTKLFHFNHQPTNPEEQAMWDWWFYMDKHDPDFQWRTPLSFYGRVIDQSGNPVPDARASLAWNDLTGSHEQKVKSGGDGRFELTGASGKALSVHVGKPGYVGSGASVNQGFEYSAFFEPHFHVPDKDKPVLFRLWNLENAEPMYFWNKLKNLTVDGQKVWFDTKTGKFGASGDVAFSTKRGATYALRQFDWSLLIEAAPGGGVALRNEELMFEAPEGGYYSGKNK